MKRIFRGKQGVSPVIAVILMVAVTVVLAGVVFLWAQSFTEHTGEEVSFFHADITVRTDEGTPPTQELEVLMLKGKVEWNKFEVHFEGIQLAGSVATTTAGSAEIFIIPNAAAGGMDIQLSTEYNVRIISIDNLEVIYNGKAVCIHS